MDRIRRFFYHYFCFAHSVYSAYDDILDTKLFVSEIPRELRAKISELEDHYFICKYCNKVYPGPEVEIVNQEQFGCKDCLEKIRRCHSDED